ncbi:tetratricopeptide repeat protein [Brevundimonas sp.]|uniref:tetratricopeptide repeat protein n=1 Tax=Brevundimonas sp. TaxID=1871086 RepID=UPI0028AE9581|nr:tetratricopeptide repeat protein [Brevundimonas sp.]
MIDLFRSDNVVVRAVPAEDVSRWVVTFDNYGLGPGFDRPGFGEDFLRQSGVSAIHVLGRSDDWYQYPEMAEAMAAVRQATQGAARVLTYGSSMGGYAAVRFADAAGADAALAISPQYSIDPARVPFETRWLQDGKRIAFRPEIEKRLACQCRPTIVFDSSSNDDRHARLIADEIDADLIGLDYVHHPATTYLSEIGLLGGLVFDALSGTLDVPGFRVEATARRRNSAVYLSRLSEMQPACRLGLAKRLAMRAVDRAPHSPLALTSLAHCLGRMEEHDQAIALYAQATELGQRSANYLVPYANGLIAAGRLEEALDLAVEAVEELPAAAHLRYWLGTIFSRLGRGEEAAAALEAAVALDPHQPVYRQLLEECRPRLDEGPEGLKFSHILRFVRRRISAPDLDAGRRRRSAF